MRSKVVLALIAMLLLSGCSGPSFTVIVNNTFNRIAIAYASPGWGAPGSWDADNRANGSPWFWPLRTRPVLGQGRAHTLTAYCYGCQSEWAIEIRQGGCNLRFQIPSPPDDAGGRPEWQMFLAYGEATLQLESDHRLYRVPAYPGHPAYAALVPQPEGYPLSPISRTGCDEQEPA